SELASVLKSTRVPGCSSDLKVSLLGCGGYSEGNWYADHMYGSGRIDVLSRDENTVTLAMDVAFNNSDDSWIESYVTLPAQMGDPGLDEDLY
ncbi:MAG: hypothetical protein AAFV53_43330, partial [Myxococcota bacterium]